MVFRNIVEVHEEKPLFQLFFLKDEEEMAPLLFQYLQHKITSAILIILVKLMTVSIGMTHKKAFLD